MVKLALYKGRTRVFDRSVQWWTSSPYSHCELVVSGEGGTSMCLSSSFMDKGVRMKQIELNPERWDIIDLPWADEIDVIEWFSIHQGEGYDLFGLLGFVFPYREDKSKWWCSEACAAALGLPDAWKYSPDLLASFAMAVNQFRPIGAHA